MADELLAQLEVVGRLQESLQGEELTRARHDQCNAFLANLQRVKKFSDEVKGSLLAAVAGVPFEPADKVAVLTLLARIRICGKKRVMQDFLSWPSFGTPKLWQTVADNPTLAIEIICQHVNLLGLINPTKATQKSIAAHTIVAEGGALAFAVSEAKAEQVFKAVGKRLKQLYKAEPLEYIERLPASPADLLRLHPLTAKRLFSRENLPCACPLASAAVSSIEAKVHCRNSGAESETSASANAGQSDMQQMMGVLVNALARLAPSAQQGHQRGDISLLPPGTLFGVSSPVNGRFQQLVDSATPPKEANVGPSTALAAGAATAAAAAGAAGGGDTRSPSQRFLAIADCESDAENKAPVAPPKTPSKASEMRAKLKAARDGLAADRAAVGAKAARGPAKASKAGKKITKAKKKTTPAKKTGKKKHVVHKGDKPKSWLKVRPNGCSKCRYMPGCTNSCYEIRGEAVPK